MANNIVGGLFGINPEQLMQQRQTTDAANAFRYAQLDPLERANMSIYQGGAGLARGVQGLLGGDPELERISKIKQLSSQFDLTTSTGARDFARALQPFAPNEAMMAAKRADEIEAATGKAKLTQAQTVKALRETRTPTSNLGKLITERDELVADGMSPKDPRIAAYDKAIAAAGEGNAPKLSLDLKMLDAAAGRRKDFITENKPLIDQGGQINQALTLISADTPFSQAAFENTVVSAFGGDKQKSVKEIQRLINTGSFDQRIENSLRKFATGKIGDATQDDQRNILEAVQGDLKRRYNSRRENIINSSRNVKELQGQEDYMAPTYEEMVGGGAAQGKKAYTVGETFNSKKQGVLTVTKVDAAGQPIEARNSAGQIGTLKGTK
jgi:hypothetical protein